MRNFRIPDRGINFFEKHKDNVLCSVFWYREFILRNDCKLIIDNTKNIKFDDLLLCTVIKNEKIRLPFFLKYYRSIGVDHFIIIDNMSTDGTSDFIAKQNDCSLFYACGNYTFSKSSIFWKNLILRKFATNHYVVIVDPDEFLIYPYSDTRSLKDFTDHLFSINQDSVFTPLIDCYAKDASVDFEEGDNMFEKYKYFDGYGYIFSENYGNKGGIRERLFYHDRQAPVMKKFALVKWKKNFHLYASTHRLIPSYLSQIPQDGTIPTGCLLHFKLTSDMKKHALEKLKNKQIFKGGYEYMAYIENPHCDFFAEGISKEFIDWRSLIEAGLMQIGNWR